ncbi:hypothetical protein VNO77_30327 [Canavalia gladiata]|uniref:Legume lectin domain-containing protein n=1 Tax=Canavalia gladiata TaxID=3824 RepID=A0AAN9KPD2_CANGL
MNVLTLSKGGKLHWVIVIVLVLAFPPPFKTVESLFFNITNFNDPESASDMAYEGDGKVTDGSIQLNIVNYYFRVGRAYYSQPLHLWDPSSGILTDFTTRFVFTIDKANKSDTTYADGFAFYLGPRGYEIPPNAAGGTFALFNNTFNSFLPQNHVVAVEFDTFVGSIDPPMQHVGIDNNSLISAKTAKFDIDKNLGNKCHTLITYTASNKTLTVYWSFNGTPAMPNSNSNSSLSCQIDLMKMLPEWVEVGFSASTGIDTEYNIIHSWEFTSTLNSNASTNSTDVTNNGKHKGSKTVILVVVVTCATVLGVVMLSVTAWVLAKKRRGNFGDNNEKDEHGSTLVKFDLDRETMPRRFDYKELIASGRRTYHDGEFHVPLTNWVWPLYVEGNVLDAADERLNNEFDLDQMRSLLIVGLWCTHPNDKERPKAEEVIKVLKLEAPLPVLPLDMRQDHPPSPPPLMLRQPSHSFQSTPITNSFASVGR